MSSYYLAIGDSITAGFGVNGKSFAFWYYSDLKSKIPDMSFVNCGINGLTTGKLANLLSYDNRLKNLVRNAKIITLTIGSNDLLQFIRRKMQGSAGDLSAVLSEMAKNLNIIGTQIRFLNPNAPVKVGTLYNPLPVGPFFQYAGSAQKIIAQANKIIVHNAKCYGFTIVPINKIFQGREQAVIGPDHLHPSWIGQEIIAAAFAS